jgi:hypothetical protein
MVWISLSKSATKSSVNNDVRVRLLPLYPFRIILRLLEAVGSVLWVRAHFFFWGKVFGGKGWAPVRLKNA